MTTLTHLSYLAQRPPYSAFHCALDPHRAYQYVQYRMDTGNAGQCLSGRTSHVLGDEEATQRGPHGDEGPDSEAGAGQV